jgi:hypothetical protein
MVGAQGLLDYDAIDDWEPLLSAALQPVVSAAVRDAIARSCPRYVEDARDALLSLAPRSLVIDATLCWLRAHSVAGYHGSRGTTEETESIRAKGLLPLTARNRRSRLERALSRSPRWHQVGSKLDSVMQSLSGERGEAGSREGQTHLTLSRAALAEGFNHYLKYGAEFDYHAAYRLLGQEGCDLLATDGAAILVTAAVPGAEALGGSNFHWSVEEMLRRGETPNMVKEFLAGWAFRLAHPSYQTRTLRLDCGIRFRHAVPAEWLVSIEQLAL